MRGRPGLPLLLARRDPLVRRVGDEQRPVAELDLTARPPEHDLGRRDDPAGHARSRRTPRRRRRAHPWSSNPTGVGTGVSSASALPSSRAARSSGMRDDLERRAEHELPRVQHERLLAVRLDQRGQVVLLQRRVDVGVPGVVEDPEEPVEPDVDARGLHQRRVVGLEPEPPLGDRGLDVAVGQQHGAESRESPRSPLRANLLNPGPGHAVHHRSRRTSAAGRRCGRLRTVRRARVRRANG